MNLLQITGLCADLGGRRVLEGLSLTIGCGEFVGLIGPNGAGKSTLLRAVAGFVPAIGAVSLNGRRAGGLDARTRAREIAYLPQEREIAWGMPVRDVVALGRLPHRPRFAGETEADRTAIARAMARMDVTRFAGRSATELSGGEKARVLIARVLAQDAPLLLADEPTAGLDPAHQIGLMRLFAQLAREGRGVIASLHDLGLAARWCTRLILIDAGRIVADAPPELVLDAANLRTVYGIEAHIAAAAGGLIVQPIDLTDEWGVT